MFYLGEPMASSKAKKITLFFIILVVIVAILGLIKFFQVRAQIAAFSKMAPPPPVVSTAKVQSMQYQNTDNVVGTFKAIQGVDITPQVSGEITHIYVHSGQVVQKGQPIIQLDNRTSQTAFANAQAAFQNASIALNRAKHLLKINAISQSTYDSDVMTYKQAKATMTGNAVALTEHTIKAPFAGKLGITQINIGQFINPGENIVTLQTQNPIHVNFNLPEKDLAAIVIGGKIDATIDRYPNHTFHGHITAINSTIDPSTHTIAVQGTFMNLDHLLYPGGFATIKVYLGKPQTVLGIPNTAVTYRLYGDSVYVVTSTTSKGKSANQATLKYITVGNPINDTMVAVAKGLKLNDVIVTAGQNKLQEQNIVSINNNVPKNLPNPVKHLT